MKFIKIIPLLIVAMLFSSCSAAQQTLTLRDSGTDSTYQVTAEITEPDIDGIHRQYVWVFPDSAGEWCLYERTLDNPMTIDLDQAGHYFIRVQTETRSSGSFGRSKTTKVPFDEAPMETIRLLDISSSGVADHGSTHEMGGSDQLMIDHAQVFEDGIGLGKAAQFDLTTGYLEASSTVSSQELGYLDGVTSSVQDQFDALDSHASQHEIGGSDQLSLDVSQVVSSTVDRAAQFDMITGHLEASPITQTELLRLDGVDSNIQDQLDAKSATTHTHSTNDTDFTVVTAVQLSSGNLQYKTRTISITDGIVVATGSESGWTNASGSYPRLLYQLDDVILTNPTSGDVLTRSTGYWENQ